MPKHFQWAIFSKTYHWIIFYQLKVSSVFLKAWQQNPIILAQLRISHVPPLIYNWTKWNGIQCLFVFIVFLHLGPPHLNPLNPPPRIPLKTRKKYRGVLIKPQKREKKITSIIYGWGISHLGNNYSDATIIFFRCHCRLGLSPIADDSLRTIPNISIIFLPSRKNVMFAEKMVSKVLPMTLVQILTQPSKLLSLGSHQTNLHTWWKKMIPFFSAAPSLRMVIHLEG